MTLQSEKRDGGGKRERERMEPKELRALSMKGCILNLLRNNDSDLKAYPIHIQRMLVKDSLRILQDFFEDVTTRYNCDKKWTSEKYKRVKRGHAHPLIPNEFRLFAGKSCGGRERVWKSARLTMRALIKLQQLDRKLAVQ